MSETPQCDRLNNQAEERETLDHFLSWLEEKHQVSLAFWGENVTFPWGRLMPFPKSHDDLVMEFLGVDPVALEQERRALLDSLRSTPPPPGVAAGAGGGES